MESLGVPRVKASLLLELHMIQKNNKIIITKHTTSAFDLTLM